MYAYVLHDIIMLAHRGKLGQVSDIGSAQNSRRDAIAVGFKLLVG